jgi:putative endonuclease
MDFDEDGHVIDSPLLLLLRFSALITLPGESRDPLQQTAMSFVYLLSSKPHGTLYVGSTSDLLRRVWEHKIKAIPGFTAKYGIDRLVWFEIHESLAAAAQRERRIKDWKRAWKITLIERDNPHWVDLYPALSA